MAEAALKCTYCGGTKFFEGPSGGMSTNILCANEKCRHWFNATPFGLDDLNKVEPTADEEARKRAELKAEADAARLVRYNEGRTAFLDGKPAGTVRTSKAYGGYAEAADNIDGLCGFVDAMAEQMREKKPGTVITHDVDAILGKEQN